MWAEGTVLGWYVCLSVCLSVCLCVTTKLLFKLDYATALNLCKELAMLPFYKTG